MQSNELIPLKIAVRRNDRTRALIDGRAKSSDFEMNFVVMTNVDEMCRRMVDKGEFDVSEFSLSGYLNFKSQDNVSLLAVPVFPARVFRHSYIFCNKNANIKEPLDLVGRKVGFLCWQMTAGVWIRGILQHEYEVPLDKIHWVRFRDELYNLRLHKRFDITDMPQLDNETSDERASDALERGEIDALIAAAIPNSLIRAKNVRRLFDDPENIENEYYKKTKVFPIMHTVVMKEKLHRENPWLAKSLVQAFELSKKMGYEQLASSKGDTEFARLQAVVGSDPYPYGLKQNRKVVETLMRYQVEQGISEKEMRVDDIFVGDVV